MFAAAVLLSVIGLLIGPALVSWTRGTRTTFAALDGATLGIVPGLVLLRLLPHLVEETGAWAIGACAFGYLVFSAVESRAHGRATDIGIAIVLPALAIHGFLDGAGLAIAFQRTDVLGAGAMAVGAALVLHKIPEGLFVASVLLPTLGRTKTGVRILALAAATVLGALSGRELLAHTPDRALHVLVALGLGVMLRMAIHRHGTAPAASRERLASGLAFVGSLAVLLAAPDPQRLFMRAQPGELTAIQALAPLLLETAPWLLLALLVGELVARRRRDEEGDGITRSDMWLPMVALSLPLLGVFFTLVRALLEPFCGAARLPGFGVQPAPTQPSARGALAFASRAAPRAMLVLPSYVVGVVLSVAIEAAVPGHGLDVGLVALPFVVALAVVLRIGAAGVTVVAALLAHKGLSLPVALVFTGVAAHAASVTHRGLSLSTTVRALAAVSVAVVVMHLVGPLETPPLHGLAAHPHPFTEWLAGAVITTWALVQLVTSGPRSWFAGAPPLSGGEQPATDPPSHGSTS
jgi:uncharacterized protein